MQARRAEGIHRFQLKIGADPYEDAARTRSVVEATGPEDVVVADANGGWRLQDAVVAARAARRSRPRLLRAALPDARGVPDRAAADDAADGARRGASPTSTSLLRAYEAKAMEAFNLKISKVGGLTQAKLMRDLAGRSACGVTIEDTWGGDLVTAARVAISRRARRRRRSSPSRS